MNEKMDALAGLRSQLSKEVKKLPGARILDGKFTAVQQAVGINKGNEAALLWLEQFVEEIKANGLVARLIKKYNVEGKLTVAP